MNKDLILKPEFQTPDFMLRLINYLALDLYGSSSRTILHDIAGVPNKWSAYHPVDYGDFGRCLTLLKHLPELRPHLDVMKHRGSAWTAVIEDFENLERAHIAKDHDYHRAFFTKLSEPHPAKSRVRVSPIKEQEGIEE